MDQKQLKGGCIAFTNLADKNSHPEAKRELGVLATYDGLVKQFIGNSVVDAQWTDPTKWKSVGATFAQTVIVAIDGGNYTSIKEACDSITDATALKPYSVHIQSGVYTEDAFSVPDYVVLIGYNIEIKPSNNGVDFITLGIESEIKGCKIIPPTSAKAILMAGINGRIKDSSINGVCVCGIEITATGCVIRDCDVISTTKGICIASGGVITSAIAMVGCTTGVELSGTGTLLGSGLACISCTIDLRTLDTSSVELAGSKINISKVEIADWDNIKISANSDQEGDEALVNTQEFQNGIAEKGSETVLGEGDSYVRGMLCYTETELNVFTDRTAAAKSASGSTLQFDGVVADNCIYLASTLHDNSDYLKFWGTKTSTNTAVIRGSGEIVFEYWNGSIWSEFNAMESDSNGKYYPHAKNYFQDTGAHQIRFNAEMYSDNWTKNNPMSLGTSYYWIRIRIKTAITTSPIIEQFKLHTSRLEVNADGFMELFGGARNIKQLYLNLALGKPFEGSMQNQTLYVSENVGLGGTKNKFTATGDIIGLAGFLPQDLDTSSPIKIQWSGMASVSETITWTIRWAWVKEGDPLTAAEPGAIANSSSITVAKALTLNTVSIIEALIDVSQMVAVRDAAFGDQIWISIQPSTMTGQFSLSGASQATYTAWSDGGHI